jgi:hypothetical protein
MNMAKEETNSKKLLKSSFRYDRMIFVGRLGSPDWAVKGVSCK